MRRARRAPRDHGRVRLRRGRREDPRGLPHGPHGRRRRRRGRAGDPLPGQPGQRLPHDEDARPAPLRLLQQERRDPRHGPAPGHRVGHADRGDAARRAADQPVRLRRRLRHRPQPVPHAGRDRLPAHGARLGRPDARVHPPAGHRAMYRARGGERARARRARPDLQPDDGGPPRHRPRRARGAAHGRGGRHGRQSAQGGRRERPRRGEHAAARSRPRSRSRSRRTSSSR